jgi:hypothetical protein
MTIYATIADLKNTTGKKGSDQDSTLELLLEAASRWCDDFCNRKRDGFVALTTATARIYTGSGTTAMWIHECVSVTSVAVKQAVNDATYTAWAATDWLAATGRPENPDYNSTPYDMILVNPVGDQSHFLDGRFTAMRGFRPESNERGRGAPTVQVTAKWGYATTVPAAVKQATLIQAARWFKRGESAWADAVSSTDFQQLLFRRDIDVDAKLLLVAGGYRRPSIGGRDF